MSDRELGVSEAISGASVAADADLNDLSIRCIDCSSDFIWTIGEQSFFRDKKLENPPKRCKDCKKAKNERLEAITNAQKSGVKQRIEVKVSCARCSEPTTV